MQGNDRFVHTLAGLASAMQVLAGVRPCRQMAVLAQLFFQAGVTCSLHAMIGHAICVQSDYAGLSQACLQCLQFVRAMHTQICTQVRPVLKQLPVHAVHQRFLLIIRSMPYMLNVLAVL